MPSLKLSERKFKQQLALDLEPIDDAYRECPRCGQRQCDCDWALQISFAALSAGLAVVVR